MYTFSREILPILWTEAISYKMLRVFWVDSLSRKTPSMFRMEHETRYSDYENLTLAELSRLLTMELNQD